MSGLKLKTVTRSQGNNRALKEGTIRIRTCELEFIEVDPLVSAFRRMVQGLEFDICEMALTTYITARAYGKRFSGLPIFLVRAFHHGAIVHNTRSGISGPKDLEGKRVGVNRGYTVTTGLWARAILQHHYGVDLNSITWVLSGDEHVAEYRPPRNVIPVEKGKQLLDLVESGELPAAIGLETETANVRRLIPNAAEAGFEALREWGHYPINHLIVVRDELLESHRELAAEVFNAFAESKRDYVRRLQDGQLQNPTSLDIMLHRVMEITGRDPLPYGIAPNRRTLEEIIQYAWEQRIIDRPVTVEELFPPSTHELVG
jgi:4,5-dihydroxyphthalate decarboxylase